MDGQPTQMLPTVDVKSSSIQIKLNMVAQVDMMVVTSTVPVPFDFHTLTHPDLVEPQTKILISSQLPRLTWLAETLILVQMVSNSPVLMKSQTDCLDLFSG